MDTPQPVRRRWNVGAVKVPYEQRDVAHAVLTPADDRGFFNIIGGADDPADGHTQPIGADVTYRVELTDEEADRFRRASNCRYVELDGVAYDDYGGLVTPATSSMRFMGADFIRSSDVYHGRDQLVAMLDGGTTTAVRTYLGATMVARQVFSTNQPGADEITSDHGCKVAPCLIPWGGRFLDVIVSEDNGTRSVSASAAAATWAADQGAKIVNYSGSSPSPSTTWNDALQYLLDRDVQFFAAAGNDGTASINYPAALSTTFANCHSSIAWDENTNTRGSFSNHAATASGCAPGAAVLVLSPEAVPLLANGTSMSAPHMAMLCAMGATGGRFTAAQVGAALKANTRATGQSAGEQGGGAYDLTLALTALGGFSGMATQPFRRNLSPNPSFETNATGYSLAAVRGTTGSTTGTGGSGGPLTNRLNVAYTNSAGTSSTGHIYAAGLDWSKTVGVLLYTDGSGEYGLKNPSSTYLLAGENGLINIAKKHNMVLVTPLAPGGGCDDGGGTCWYDKSGSMQIATKIRWSDDFVRDQVLTKYDIDTTRVCIAGYSSGAQFTSEYYGPQYASAWMKDGLLLAISYGGSPKVTANYPTAFKNAVAAVWDVGANDGPAYNGGGEFDAQSGYDWYRTNGFVTTELNVIPSTGHARDGQFGAICDREITQHVPASVPDGTAPAGGGITANGVLSASITTPFGAQYLAINITGDGSTSATVPDIELALPNCPVTAGQPYVFSAHARNAAAGRTLQWYLRWEDAGGANLGAVTGAKDPLMTSVWGRYIIAGTAPTGATRAVLRLRGWGFTNTAVQALRLDGFHLERTQLPPGSYFDGASSGAAWEGVAHNSTSTLGTAPVTTGSFDVGAYEYGAVVPGGGTGAFTVSAGADAQVLPGGAFNRTATETGTGTVATRQWTVAAIPAGASSPAVGTVLSTAAALTWTAPATAGVYQLRYAAYAAGSVLLDDDDVAVEVTTNPSVPSNTPIIIEPEPLVFPETFGTPRLELVAAAYPTVPTFPGFNLYPGPKTFPGHQRDPRYGKKRTGWTTYPGPDLFPGPKTWPGFGLPEGLPAFDVEFFLLDDAGSYRCALPDVKAFTLTDIDNSTGSVTFDYPARGINFALLREHVDADIDATVAVRFAGTREWERLALISECDGDDVAEGAIWRFTGAWSAAALEESVVYPDPGSADGKVSFVDATPGDIVADLVARAQQRGGMDITVSTFSGGFDSRSEPWPTDSIASPTFAPGDSSTYLRVLQLLRDAGLCEWEMRGRSLRLYRAGGRGFDRTVGLQVVLQAGRDLLEASRRRTVRGSVTSLLVLGSNGEWTEVVDGTALGRRRRRVEGTASQGQLSGGALRAYGFAKLASATEGQVERVHKLAFVEGSPLPVRDFDTGDTLWSDADGNRRRLRVAQWMISRDDRGLTGSVSLGDLIDDPLLKLARKLLGIGDGSVVGAAAGGGPRAVEGVTPAAPTGLAVASVATPGADGASVATLLLAWDPVVTAADGVSGVNVTGYRVRWRYAAQAEIGAGGPVPLVSEWQLLDDLGNDTSALIEGVVPAAAVEVQVGAYSIVTTTPTTPTDPTDPGPGTPGPVTPGSGPIPIGGGTGGGPVGTTVADILRLGKADGLTKVNLGVDFLSGDGPEGRKGTHVDYTLDQIVTGLGSEVMPKYVEVRSNGAVRLTAFVGAATTPNSKKSRTEFRELGPNGVDKAAWDARQGEHYLWVRGAVIKLPTGRKRMCIAQLHDSADDVCMILVDQGVNVESTFGDTGRPGRLTSELELGKVYEWMIRVKREGSQTIIQYFWDTMTTAGATQTWAGNSGCYWKVGNYQQSEPQYDQTGETGILDLHDVEIWHTGYPPPRARGGGGTGSGVTAWVAITEQAYNQLATKDPRTVYIVGAVDGNASTRPITSASVLSRTAYEALPSYDPATLYILVEGLLTSVILDTVVPITVAAFQALTPKNPRAIYLVTGG